MRDIVLERPTLVVGVGGMGKHIVTHVKHLLVTRHGAVPREMGLLSLDTAGHADVRRARIDTIEDWKKTTFTLDYSDDSSEFVHFGGRWGEKVFKIALGQRSESPPDPYISAWLRPDDAEMYLRLTEEDLSARRGVGQMRQASRACLFMKMGEEGFVRRLRSLAERVGRFSTQQKGPRVLVVGSIAGGTGCGVFWDVAVLLQHYLAEHSATEFLGIVVLPKGLEGLEGVEASHHRLMRANCYAAFRELERIMYTVGPDQPLSIDYSLNAPGVSLRDRLFNLVFLVDGSSLSRLAEQGEPYVPYYHGIVPAIADFAYLHLVGCTDDHASIGREIATRMQDAVRYPRDGGIYSSFGIHRLVLDARGLTQSFGARLAIDVLDHMVGEHIPRPSSAELEEEVITFLASPTNTPFNRAVAEMLQRPDMGLLGENALLQMMRASRTRPVQLRPVDLGRVRVSRLGRGRHSSEVLSEVNTLIAAHLGRRGDGLDSHSPAGSLHAILGSCYSDSRMEFADQLRRAVETRADCTRNPAGLLYVLDFLEELGQHYEAFAKQLSSAGQEAEKRRKSAVATARKARERLGRSNSGRDQRAFLATRQDELRWERIVIMLGYLAELTEEHRSIAGALLEGVAGYIRAVIVTRENMTTFLSGVNHVRRTAQRVKVRRYVTTPGDEWEERMYRLMLGTDPDGEGERSLCDLLPSIVLENLVGEFGWKVEGDDEPRFVGYLSDSYVPLADTASEIDRWNFHFVNRMVELGHLRQLEEDANIFDILAWQAETRARQGRGGTDAYENEADRLMEMLQQGSQPMLQIDEARQASTSSYGMQVSAVQTSFSVVGPWRASPPGQWVSEPLVRILGRHVDEQVATDPHEIIARTTVHYLRPAAVRNLATAQDGYTEHMRSGRFPPLHVFLPEKAATRYEQIVASGPHPGLLQRMICPQVVSLLEDEPMMRVFARAFALRRFTRDIEDERTVLWIDVEYGGSDYRVTLPFSGRYLEAVEAFCAEGAKEKALKDAVSQDVTARWDQMRTEAMEHQEDAAGQSPLDVVRQQRDELRRDLLRVEDPAEADLRLVLSVMLDRELEVMGLEG